MIAQELIWICQCTARNVSTYAMLSVPDEDRTFVAFAMAVAASWSRARTFRRSAFSSHISPMISPIGTPPPKISWRAYENRRKFHGTRTKRRIITGSCHGRSRRPLSVRAAGGRIPMVKEPKSCSRPATEQRPWSLRGPEGHKRA